MVIVQAPTTGYLKDEMCLQGFKAFIVVEDRALPLAHGDAVG